MKKRIIPLITAAAMMIPMTAVNAGAVGNCPFDLETSPYKNYVDRWEYLEKFSDIDTVYYYEKLENNPLYDRFIGFERHGGSFSAHLGLDTDTTEIDAIMSELAPDLNYRVMDSWLNGEKCLWFVAFDGEIYSDNSNAARQVCDAFKEHLDVLSFRYTDHFYVYNEYLLAPGEGFPYRFTWTDATVEEVQAVIDEKGLDYEIEIITNDLEARPDLFRINPTRIMDFDESTEQLMPFIEKYGLKGLDIETQKNDMGHASIDDVEIDMLGSLDGDANCDGALTVADATAVLQSIGNPDKYGLSAQAKFNADIYNTGDGVTALDALKILRIEAGLE